MDFWTVTFLGVAGSITGALSLFISYLTWQYSRPRIRITRLELYTRHHEDEWLRKNKSKKPEFFRDYFLRFILVIRLANEKGGAGAIEKPVLVIQTGPKRMFSSRAEIVLKPGTQELRTHISSASSYSTETIDLGASFNLSAGQILEDQLQYNADDTETKYAIAQNYDNASFLIRYHTNSGKKHEVRLKLTFRDNF